MNVKEEIFLLSAYSGIEPGPSDRLVSVLPTTTKINESDFSQIKFAMMMVFRVNLLSFFGVDLNSSNIIFFLPFAHKSSKYFGSNQVRRGLKPV